ncbi:MAG: outer membrane protein transport protein [Ignavibacteriae bacterium]|nr:outer membrane protein transport protein [Ignavibacteriota bacterium]
MIKKSLVLLCVFVFCYSIINAQDGTRAIDYNTRSTGRGGVSIGFFDNPSVMITNPAGISFLNRSMLDANAIFMVPPPKFTNYKKDSSGVTTTNLLNEGVDGEKTLYVLPSLSYVHKIDKSKFTLGAGVFTTGGMGADFSLNHELYKDASSNYIPQTYHSRFSTVQGGLTGAYKFTDNFSVGVTAQLLWANLEFKNPFSMAPSKMTGVIDTTGMTFGQMFSNPRTVGGLGYTEVTSSADMKELNAYSFAGKFGLAYKFSEKFTVGVSYSMPVPLKFKNGISNLDMSAQFADAFERAVQNVMNAYHVPRSTATTMVNAKYVQMGIDVNKGFTAQYDIDNEFEIPQSIGFGFKYAPNDKLRLGFDFEWINWSKSFDKMVLTLRNGTNDNINRMMGQGGPGQPDFVVDFLLNWKDAIILKFGGEYDLSKKSTIRLGYAYGTNPVPSETVIPIIPAVLEHHIMAGFSYLLTKDFMANMGVEYGLNNKVTGSNPHLVAAEYNNSIAELKNLLGHLSLTYSF